MRALRLARYGLLLSALVYAAALVLGHFRVGDGEMLFAVAILSGIGIGLCAILCVVLQFVVLPLMRSRT